MSTKIDPNTGLPQLPEGYFWRIKTTSHEVTYSPLEIQIRKKVLHYFSKRVDYAFTDESYLPKGLRKWCTNSTKSESVIISTEN